MIRQDTQQARDYFASKVAYTAGPLEVDGMLRRGESVCIVDVRASDDYAKGHIAGAVNLPKGLWHTAYGLDRGGLAVVYGYDVTCKLAAEAAVEFAARRYPVVEMLGGVDAWLRQGLPLET